MPKNDPEWAHGHPHPRHYLDWRDWIKVMTDDLVLACEDNATLGRRLRPVSRTELEAMAADMVRGSLERSMVGSEVERATATELIIGRAVERLETRGYVVG